MTPDMSAETWLGAAGWASGSQTCSGMTPAFPANPSPRRTKTALRDAPDSAGAAVPVLESRAASPRAEQQHAREEARGRRAS